MFVMKDNKVGPAHLKIASSPSYTLDEIEQLARTYTTEAANRTTDELVLSLFLAWLAKREQGEVSKS